MPRVYIDPCSNNMTIHNNRPDPQYATIELSYEEYKWAQRQEQNWKRYQQFLARRLDGK